MCWEKELLGGSETAHTTVSVKNNFFWEMGTEQANEGKMQKKSIQKETYSFPKFIIEKKAQLFVEMQSVEIPSVDLQIK